MPRKVTSMGDTGLTPGFLSDLVVKALYLRGQATPADLTETLRIPYYGVMEEILRDLTNQELCFIARGQSMNPLTYAYTITSGGQTRGQEIMARNAYAGPAPVNLEDYWQAVAAQTVEGVMVNRSSLEQAFKDVVIDPALFDQLGPAINSSRAMFLFGPPGNGKTMIAETLVRLQGGEVYIPYAIEVGGEIVRVYDPVHHPRAAGDDPAGENDPRWVRAKRPVVAVGGELTLPMLDLIYNQTSKYYEAPFQLKANNGAFFIDDFGRQQVAPRDLLNRWIVPLEKRVDYLTLLTGQKIEVPFDTLVMFSTNLDPKELVDDAFLRRIRYKIEIKSPSAAQYKEIFRRVCASKGIAYDEAVVDYLLNEKYPALEVAPRAVHPRDLVEQIIDYADYRQMPPAITRETVDLACQNYFVRL
ncbi:MAG: ATP-binding protein [Chloroflexi bacterium]|nr:ATP-binding protein [Chloroflexota bacterium]